jgi:hypothetical protein
MRAYFYCKSWFRAEKCPTEVWTEAQARAAHADRSGYTVLVDDVEAPFAFIDLARDFVGVGFLDGHLRTYLEYVFDEVESGRLFLAMAVYREYAGDTDKVRQGTSYIFKQDGGLTIREASFEPNELVVKDGPVVDVSLNYDAYPAFGDYAHLLRIERMPALD